VAIVGIVTPQVGRAEVVAGRCALVVGFVEAGRREGRLEVPKGISTVGSAGSPNCARSPFNASPT